MIDSPKILSFPALVERVAELRADGRRVALCHGVFDLLHVGHLRYLEGAARLADVVVVTVTPDRWVDKGPFRPAFDLALRLEALAALEVVDLVAPNAWPTAEETLRQLRPDVYVKGAEFARPGADPTGKMERERAVAAEVGCTMEFVDDLTSSSSRLINRHLSIYPEPVARWLDGLRARHRLADVLEFLDRMASLRVVVIGDAILDHYVDVETLGKASKDPALAVRELRDEEFAGGAVAVAHHIAAFGCSVELISVLGDDEAGEILRSALSPAVRGRFVQRADAATVRKRRIVDAYSRNKLLSIYRMDVTPPTAAVAEALADELRAAAAGADLVVCADYGHQAIPEALLEVIAGLESPLAINVQANAGNRGFHTVTRHARADFVFLAEHEIRLETRDSEGALRPMMHRVASQLGASLFVVTRGKRGSLAFADGDFHEAPALAHEIVDRIGAGDAFFALAALAARLGAPPDLVSLLGNAAGGQAVATVGNRSALDPQSLRKQLTALLA
ncbi:MAG: PfkB family carbohydrate kinase [Acidobacteriota bacterium]